MRKILSVIKLLILLTIVIGLPLYIYFENPALIEQFRTMEGVNEYLSRYKTSSIFVFIGLQIVQIIISIIPGQFIQFAGGYAYGFWLGYLFAMIGIAIGTVFTFYLARILGKGALHVLFGEERIAKFVKQLNSKRAFAILAVLFLIPGFPKDLITYAAGVSEFGIKPFLLLSLIARSPALMGTIMMGSMLRDGSYLGLIILSVIAVILFIACFIKRRELTAYADKIYDKLIRL